MNYTTKDSGKREEFNTGSKRDTSEGKHRFDLIWVGMLIRLAALMARGAAKYGENNWMKGQPISRYWESLLRHAYAWKNGDDPNEDHLAAIIFNVMGIMFTVAMVKSGGLPFELLKNTDGTWFECQDTIHQDNPDVAEERVYKPITPNSIKPTPIRQLFSYLLRENRSVTHVPFYVAIGRNYPYYFQSQFGNKLIVRDNVWEVVQHVYEHPDIKWIELFQATGLLCDPLDGILNQLFTDGLISNKGTGCNTETKFHLTID